VQRKAPVALATSESDSSTQDSRNRSVGVDARRFRRHWDALAELGRDPAGGWTRLAYSADEARARLLVGGWLAEAGLTVRVDPAGNLRARTRAVDPQGPTVLVGSHLDTVPHGGSWDGALGVVAAAEAVAALADAGLRTEWPVEVVAFAATEPARFGPAAQRFGSRAMAGLTVPADTERFADADGITLAAAMTAAGLVPELLTDARIDRNQVHCMVELHVERGHALAAAGVPVGVVTAIAGTGGPAPTDPLVQALIRSAAADVGVPVTALTAGAGHDVRTLAPYLPTGMVLVRNVSGRIHDPVERVDWADAVAGAEVLTALLVRLATAPPLPDRH
jgi:acetylornithine deacetylase/succinyl-diaminopimelate desuccinylase-like protein